MRKNALLPAVAAICLSAGPVAAAKLSSGTFWLEGSVDRIPCGVTYHGQAPTTVLLEIFNFETSLLSPGSGELELSRDDPANSWRTTNCPEDGCGSPWCRVTTNEHKSQFRPTMCAEAEDGGVFTPVACIPVE